MPAAERAAAHGRILLVNGVNTAFGGSLKNLMSAWVRSLKRTVSSVTVLDTVPQFGIRRKGPLLNALWGAYFLPGTLFRVSRFPAVEMLTKLSPMLAWRIMRQIVRDRPELVVFSHHSSFVYGLLVSRRRRVFVIQDLLYVRARSMGYSKALCKLLLNIELRVYRAAEHLVVLSYHERRILERLLGTPLSLASCLDRDEVDADLPMSHDLRIALVSDWRRGENLHGLLTFFAADAESRTHRPPLEFVLYGFESAEATRQVASAGAHTGHTFTDGGSYQTFTDIGQMFFLVPIFLGAGIKRKTLESMQAGRFVLGTSGAFIGLRPSFLKGRTSIVESFRDIQLPDAVPSDIREAFRQYYFSEFSDFGDLVAGFLEPDTERHRRWSVRSLRKGVGREAHAPGV
jgi:hypothetical protein